MLVSNFGPNVHGNRPVGRPKLGPVTGRHRNPRPSLGVVAGLVAVVLLAALAGWGGYRLLSSPSCGSRVSVTVAAAPEIAPAVRTAAHPVTGQVSAGSLFELVENRPVRPLRWLSCEI